MTLSTDSAPIKTGLLAYGMSGKIFHAPFLTQHPSFDLQAVVQRHEQRMQADYPHIKSYGSVDELLADPALELVVVNTPSFTHADLARQALLAGKHVLLEKPVATTAAELRELQALAQQQGRQLLAYQNRRWDTDFSSVRDVVKSGQLGQLIEVHFRYDRFKPALNPKKFKEEAGVPGSGLLFDLGPHLVDQAISLFGPPLRVEKAQGAYRAHSLVDDFFSLHLHYPAGLHVYLTSSLLVADPGPAFVLHGTLGSYRKDRTDPQEAQLQAGMQPTDPAFGQEQPGQEGRLTVLGPDGTLATTSVAAGPGSYAGLFEAVYQSIRRGQPYPITEAELEAQLRILEE
ncbi:oxidoreductase [Hymenobacter setariae]|uniref:Oxidoreductase n=1 Tax=Hymenobacter setariae TaxID=2594794 RepID=A0A558BSE7_9BACT|nr:Gfo/Idh/MocA family oxidoreductase [Hymenobacter setariae]TVT39444.1 oxidoreductase [Hymenobacter setariae]